MPITKRQLARRTEYIGASEVPAILGLSPWKSPWEVWAQKTGQLMPRPAGEAAQAGNVLESAIASWAEQRLGKLDRRGTERRVKGTPILAHIDALVMSTREPVEFKTSGIYGPVVGDWGEENTDQVPDYYLVQAQVHMMATAADICHLVALLGGRGFVNYKIMRHDALQETIREKVAEFWDRVRAKEPPPGAPPLEALKLRKRRPEKMVTLDEQQADLVESWQIARQERLEAEKIEREALRKVLEVLDDAEAAVLPDGREFTYLERRRIALDSKAVESKYPEVAAECRKLIVYRVPNLKGN